MPSSRAPPTPQTIRDLAVASTKVRSAERMRRLLGEVQHQMPCWLALAREARRFHRPHCRQSVARPRRSDCESKGEVPAKRKVELRSTEHSTGRTTSGNNRRLAKGPAVLTQPFASKKTLDSQLPEYL